MLSSSSALRGPAHDALLLTGGGARAAYQVGVLQALRLLRRQAGVADVASPFGIISGTSAGAINAAVLASGADDFDQTVCKLVDVWRNFHVEQVYHAQALDAVRSGARWLTLITLGWALTRWRKVQPRSLLNNDPLRELLRQKIPFERLEQMREQGHLQALAITASSYTTGDHVTFCDTDLKMEGWMRSQRRALRTHIGLDHLMASSAIPFLFPAQPIRAADHLAYYGDGSMRQVAPLSAPIHLGAKRIMVIGVGSEQEPLNPNAQPDENYPPLANIAGHALSGIFNDALLADVERVERVNRTLNLIPPEQRAQTPLRPIDLLVITPSKRLDAMAAEYAHELPRTVRALLNAMGARSDGNSNQGSVLASYMMFESGYTRALMRLGRSDLLRQREAVFRFFGWQEASKRHQEQALAA